MKLSELLKDQTMISIATVDGEGKPKLRMFNHQFIVDGKICFGTSNEGGAYRELQANPNAEIMQFARGKYVRIAGEVTFADGEQRDLLKAKMEAANPRVVEMYTKDGFDAKMEIGYFENPTIRIMDMVEHTPISVEIE